MAIEGSRADVGVRARLVDDVEALEMWARRKGLLDEFADGVAEGLTPDLYDAELADIFESLYMDVKELI